MRQRRAIEERPTRHASDRAARFERHDYEGSHDIRTRMPVNYDEDALDRELDEATEEGTTEEGTTPRVRDPNATEDASEESDGAGGQEDDGLGADSSEDEETYWKRWERNRAASVQKALARQTGVRIESPAPSPMKPSRTKMSRKACLLYTSPSPRDKRQSRMPSSA